MKPNYYEEIIEIINKEKDLITKKILIETELSAPWIPETYKQKFEKMLFETNQELLGNTKKFETKGIIDISFNELQTTLENANEETFNACLEFIKLANTEKYSSIFESIFNSKKLSLLSKNKILLILLDKEDNLTFNFEYENKKKQIQTKTFNENFILPLVDSINDFIETTYKKEMFKKEKAYSIFSNFFLENLIIINRFSFEYIQNEIIQGVENEKQ
ncbi:hypothetical protein ACR34G_01015 [Mycoplasma sp. 480]|uniref:hypothetical protein n=1 Tax=Mycoplasma sp. 480 TaxID=3440155 RepID=UPI003F510F46